MGGIPIERHSTPSGRPALGLPVVLLAALPLLVTSPLAGQSATEQSSGEGRSAEAQASDGTQAEPVEGLGSEAAPEGEEPLVELYRAPVEPDPRIEPEPPPDRPSVGFDLEVARRKIETDLATPAAALEVGEALDVVTPDAYDDSVAPVRLRGENERYLDLRSVERLGWQCRSEIARRDVTLFGNGTVRLRTGLLESPDMLLDELSPEMLLSYLTRLVAVVRSPRFRAEVQAARFRTVAADPHAEAASRAPERAFGDLDGRWTEACKIQLRLPDMDPVDLWQPRMEVPSLEVSQLVAIADELAAFTSPVQADPGLGAEYIPRPGDLLRREEDGQLFRVVGVTVDGGGVELEALAEPVRIFYLLEDLPSLFGAGEPGGESMIPGDGREPDVWELTDRGGGR